MLCDASKHSIFMYASFVFLLFNERIFFLFNQFIEVCIYETWVMFDQEFPKILILMR